MRHMKLDVVFAGVGGQGIITASDILCEAALLEGFDVAKAETHGMAQRGGSIVVHVRIGDEVSSPLIESGTGDVLIGFEVLEAVRALPLLKEGGTAIVNNKFIPPLSVLQGLAESPTKNELMDTIKRKAKHVYEIDGIGLAEKAGNVLVMSTVFLGAFLSIPENPLKEEFVVEVLSQRVKASYLDVNLKALQVGKGSLFRNRKIR